MGLPEGIATGALRAVTQCMNVQADETVVVVCDRGTYSMAEALYNASIHRGAEPILVMMEERGQHADEPPSPIASAMAAADVVFGITTKSISHTSARRSACASGTRVATLPGITEEIFDRGLNVDYEHIAVLSRRLADRLDIADQVHITTELGTDLRFSIAGRKAESDGGLYHETGAFGNLPAGEASAGPLEGSAIGRLVIDGSMASIGLLSEPLVFEVEGGVVRHISGGPEAAALESTLDPFGIAGRSLAELGIGTNSGALLTGNILEDEKKLGTIHIALGNNMSYGGSINVPIHLDGVVMSPTVYLDGEPIMVEGDLLV